ncbi:MAG: hypothetical protein IJJ85_07350 [Clostridia bacterium]|nr:hypothetical protein [Clostridia bacterium]
MQYKKEFDSVWLECILPYETVANEWEEGSRERFFFDMEQCDQETMLQTGYTNDALDKLEAYIFRNADELI